MCTTQTVAVVHRKNGLLVKKMSLLLLSSFHWPTQIWSNRREKCLLCVKWIDCTNWSLNTPSQELLEYGWMDLLVTRAVMLSWSLTWLPLESDKRQASGWVHAGMSRRDKLRGDSLLQSGSGTSQGPSIKLCEDKEEQPTRLHPSVETFILLLLPTCAEVGTKILHPSNMN